MNIKRIILGIIGAAAVLVGCEPKEEDFGVAKIEVSTGQLTFGQSSESKTLQVTASRDWTVADLPEWIAVDPAGGAPSKSPQTVTVTVIANSGYNREADITFTIGLMKEYVKVSQSGEKGEYDTGNGSKERPYSASAAVDYVGSLPADTESTDAIYIKGVISAVTTTYEASGNYGNATFDISDDGSTTAPQFKVFQTYYLGNKKWTSGNDDVKVGDEVIIYGKVVNYKGNTPETVGKGASYVYSHNGKTAGDTPTPPGSDPKGTGTLTDPYNPAGAANAVKDLTWTDNNTYDTTGEVYVKGKISRIADKGTFTEGGTYGNASFYISEDGSQSGEFYCFRVLYLGNKKFVSGKTDIKVGDEVIVCGQLMNYRNDTPETVAGKAYLYSLNGDTGSGDTPPTPPAGDPKGTGTLTDPYNPAGAANAVKDLTWTDNNTYDTTGEVYVKGKISRIADKGTFTEGGSYGNASFYISEDGSQSGEFYCFRVLYLGNKKFESGQTDIKVGDEVVIYGQLMNYHNDTPETVAGKAYLYSLNGKTEDGGETPPTPPSGDGGTLNNPFDIAGAIAYIDGGGKDEVYVKGKVSKLVYEFDADHGTGTFWISDDGTFYEDNKKDFEAYSVKWLENKNWVAGNGQVKVGDEVILHGKLTYYTNTSVYETASKNAYVYSVNGNTKNEVGGNDNPGGGGEQQGNIVTVDFSSQNYENAQDFSSITVGDITISADNGSNSKNGPKYYNTGTAVRLYSGNTMTVKSSGKSIVKIEFTFGSGDGTNEITVDKGTWASPNWSGSESAVTFTVGGNSGHRRFQKLAVTLAE